MKRPIVAGLLQLSLLLLPVMLICWLVGNAVVNLQRRGIAVGFDFLARAARFPLADHLLPYTSADSFGWALLVGLGNTLYISALVILFGTLLGIAFGLLRRSSHPLARGVASVVVELTRNTPLVAQLLFWYAAITLGLPYAADVAENDWGIYFTDRGIYLPRLVTCGAVCLEWELPVHGQFNFEGGLMLLPEFLAALVGFTLYGAAFIGEIVRAGIDAVARGDGEAARALGMTERQTLWLVIMPQALRTIVPPMTSQYINMIKNSTLALVIGYPEFNFVTATLINQTGQAIEIVAILVATFLTVSGCVAFAMNRLNARIMRVQR